MATTATIPVTIEPDAAARVEELGMQREFQAMLDHTKEVVPGLRAIGVRMDYDPCEPDDPRVIIVAYYPHPGTEDDPTGRQWGRWFVEAFPPDVCRHFCMLSFYEGPNGR